jgi:hypothetical protein
MGRVKDQQISAMNEEENMPEGFAPYFSPQDQRDRDTQARISMDNDYRIALRTIPQVEGPPEIMLSISMDGSGNAFVVNLSLWSFNILVMESDMVNAELDSICEKKTEDIF